MALACGWAVRFSCVVLVIATEAAERVIGGFWQWLGWSPTESAESDKWKGGCADQLCKTSHGKLGRASCGSAPS
jgi:hypothetical protein